MDFLTMVNSNSNKISFSKLTHEEKVEEWEGWQKTISDLPPGEVYGQAWLDLKSRFVRERGIIGISAKEQANFKAMHNRYRGQRIFIIGNGPSLNKTDLSKLKNEFTFATNRFYLMYDRIDWRPTFYTCVDRRVVTDIYSEVNALTSSMLFFDEFFRGLYRSQPQVQFFNQRLRKGASIEESFSFNAANVVLNGNTVITYAIQIAYYLGFQSIYLIGCDLGYKVPDTVKQQGDDVFKMGVGFDLKSTQDDDPNHFDPRYFGKDRLWHAPNEQGMIYDHLICKNAFESKKRNIFNATVGGELEVYERRKYNDLFYSWGKFFNRLEGAAIDETEVISNLWPDDDSSFGKFMLDVGACGGGSAANFEKKGWNIHCFEPDPKNRETLAKRFTNSDRVTIDPRAVSDHEKNDVPFYSSDESVGISGLSAFRDTHRVSAMVTITTLKKVMEERDINQVDFLKIDVEGFDFSVLKGFPWSKCKPEVIECEYEDRKTLPLGNSALDICNFLVEHGYTVYISKWHPILRYGIQHQWHGVVRFDSNYIFDPQEWGNVLCFLVDPGKDRLCAAISKALNFYQNLNDYAKLSNGNLSFKEANGIFLGGDYAMAAQAYFELAKRGGIYSSAEFNRRIALSRIKRNR
jgi:FkbM family methyltransferase